MLCCRAKPVITNVTKENVELSEGCATFVLDREELARLYKGGLLLRAKATVTEAVTGTQEDDAFKKEFEKTPYKVTHEGSSDEHTVLGSGGFPYVGQLQGEILPN